jgi:hypothetical protein
VQTFTFPSEISADPFVGSVPAWQAVVHRNLNKKEKEMTEDTAVQKVAPKSKLGRVIRSVFLAVMIGLLFLLVVMAAYRKFAG